MLVSRGFPIFYIYLPSANHLAEEFQEYFDYLWALYESLSVQGYTILMGDFNCDLITVCSGIHDSHGRLMGDCDFRKFYG